MFVWGVRKKVGRRGGSLRIEEWDLSRDWDIFRIRWQLYQLNFPETLPLPFTFVSVLFLLHQQLHS